MEYNVEHCCETVLCLMKLGNIQTCEIGQYFAHMYCMASDIDCAVQTT